jgi:hypothetical protein
VTHRKWRVLQRSSSILLVPPHTRGAVPLYCCWQHAVWHHRWMAWRSVNSSSSSLVSRSAEFPAAIHHVSALLQSMGLR